MSKKALNITTAAIYILYGLLFAAHIIDNTDLRLTDENYRYSRFKQSSFIVLILFAVLLYFNLVNKQKRLLIFNSFLASALLYLYSFGIPFLAIMILTFGLFVAFLELKSADKIS